MPVDQELLYPEDLTSENLFILFERAYLQCEINQAGALKVTDFFETYIVPLKQGKVLYLTNRYATRDEATQEEKLKAVNAINSLATMLVRFTVADDGGFLIDHELYTAGGITPANLVKTVRKFNSDLLKAVQHPHIAGLLD